MRPHDPYIRLDDGVAEGGEVSMFYDPMIAKLITWAPSRSEAAALQVEALDRFRIEGLGHNVDFLSAIMQHPRFLAGELTTGFIAEEWPEGFHGAPPSEELLATIAAVVAGIDPYALLDEVVDRVATVHASDRYLEGGTVDDLRRLDADPQHGYARLLRHGVIGEGLNDFDRIFSTLAAGGFDGWVSIEDGDGETVEEGMQNLRGSVAFLRRSLAKHW